MEWKFNLKMISISHFLSTKQILHLENTLKYHYKIETKRWHRMSAPTKKWFREWVVVSSEKNRNKLIIID